MVYGSAVADGEDNGGEPEADAVVQAEPEVDGGEQVADVAGEVREVSGAGWPAGYVYGATRYADVILAQSFPDRFNDLVAALSGFHPTLDELRAGGGGRTVFVKRFDESLAEMKGPDDEVIWGKQNVTIEKSVGLDNTVVRSSRVRGHEIDMFGKGTLDEPLPGIAVEMEWNNKDPFFDRDLINFQALHHEGAIAIGVIVTRGPGLQDLIESTIRSKDGGFNREISELVGSVRVARTTWQTGGKGGRSVSGEDMAILKPEEVRQIPTKQALVVPENAPPIIAKLSRCIEGKTGRQLLAELDATRTIVERARADEVSIEARQLAALANARRHALTEAADHDG